jgi:hypothetical protein
MRNVAGIPALKLSSAGRGALRPWVCIGVMVDEVKGAGCAVSCPEGLVFSTSGILRFTTNAEKNQNIVVYHPVSVSLLPITWRVR